MINDFVSAPRVTPSRGLVTWDSEGTEGGKFHSRVLHVPTDSSGLTIGRGYDMGGKSSAKIVIDLTTAGVDAKDAAKVSKAAGLRGEAAKKFITDNGLKTWEITPEAQVLLFEITYRAEAAEAERLCTKADVVTAFGKVEWAKLEPAIQDMLVDLKFRGDYTGGARKKIQKHVVANDLEAFAAELGKKANWPNVPKDRFDRRVAFLQPAVLEWRAKKRMQERALNQFKDCRGAAA